MINEDVVVIGAGPAGISCAIQLKRYGIEHLIIEKNKIGGLLLNANNIENYPGFPDGISGISLIKLFYEQLKKKKIRIYSEEVLNLDFMKEEFYIKTSIRELRSKYVVIATGTKPKEFDNTKLSMEIKDKIFYEIHPILNLKGKKIVIVGAGDAAFDYALNLCRHNQIIILNRGNSVKCLPLLFDRVKKSSTIDYIKNAKIITIKENIKKRISIDIRVLKGNKKINADSIVFAIGREPQLDFLSNNIKDRMYELENTGLLYLAGDVKNDIFRQVAIATGDGIKSAMKIYKKLSAK